MSAHYNEGRHWVRVIDQAFGASKNKGTPEFTMKVVILGVVDPENPDGDLITCAKQERTIYNYITEGTAERLCEDLMRIGFDKDSFKFLNPAVEGYFDFKGKEFEAFCKHELYNNDTKEKWSIAFPRSEKLAAKPLEDKEVRQLDNLFGKHLKKAAPKRNASPALQGVDPQQQARANKAAATAVANGGDPEDGIPF